MMGGLRLAAAGLLLALGGCANGVGAYDPVVWWHHLEGGEIAKNRPPPPGINAPFPNLALIPSRPEALSAKARAAAASRLRQDQANGRYALAQTVPALAVAPTAPPPAAAGAMGGQMAAAGGGTANSGGASSGTAGSTAPASGGGGSGAGNSLALLTVPAAPPPAPRLPGVPWLTQATPLPQAPPMPPAPPAPGKGQPVAVRFARGSAVLSVDDATALRKLAGARAQSAVAVTGFGDATASDPAVQAAALTLAWARARAIAAELRHDGVPDAAMVIGAYAPGGGGVARLVPAG